MPTILPEMIKKFASLKRGIGIESEKASKQVKIKQYGDMLKIQLKGYYRMEINSKAFSIPILTASGLQLTIQQSE